MSGTDTFQVGLLRDLSLYFGGDINTKNTAFDPRKRSLTLGLVGGAELVLRGERHVAQADGVSDETLGHALQLFGLGVGGFDALVGHQVRGERAKHRLAVAGIAAELPPGVTVPHRTVP